MRPEENLNILRLNHYKSLQYFVLFFLDIKKYILQTILRRGWEILKEDNINT